LQGRLNQGPRAAEGVQINQVKTFTVQLLFRQQLLSGSIREPWAKTPLQQRLAIGLQHSQTIGIRVIGVNPWRDPAPRCRLQSPTQGADAAATHQVQPAQLLLIASISRLLSSQ
jgi:hypothetical protein